MADQHFKFAEYDVPDNETLRKPLRVGLLCSAFDFLHAGHLNAIEQAIQHCDILYLGLHVDPSLEREQKNSPVIPLSERFYQLYALEGKIDFIIPYQYESEIRNIVHLYNIDVVFMGEEYLGKEYTVKGMDVDVHFLARQHDVSSSKIRRRASLKEI